MDVELNSLPYFPNSLSNESLSNAFTDRWRRLEPEDHAQFAGDGRLIWQAAVDQRYVDQVLPKPKLPRLAKKQPRFFRLEEIGKIGGISKGELKCFYWLAAESGLRLGELVGLNLGDIDGENPFVRSIWHGKEQAPKTQNAIRKVGLSDELVSLLWQQIASQRAKGYEFLPRVLVLPGMATCGGVENRIHCSEYWDFNKAAFTLFVTSILRCSTCYAFRSK